MILFSSPAADAIIRDHSSGLASRSLFDLVHPEDIEHVRRLLDDALRTGLSGAIEHRRNRSGEWQTLESIGRRFEIAGNRPAVLVETRNTSDRKALEERRTEAAALETAATVSKAIAGDFNDLLGVLIRRVGRLEGSGSAEVRDEARAMRASIDRARVLFDQLLVFSDVGVLRATESSDVNQTMEGLSDSIEDLAGGDIQITYLLGAESPRAGLPAGSLEQMLIALVAYARGAMPGGGRLTIATRNAAVAPSAVTPSATRIAESLVIEITFSGIVAVADAHGRILKPELTAEHMSVGLHTVFRIAQKAGGHVAIDSEANAGTTIRVLLPVYRG